MSLAARCAAEVADLHAAFERWFAGDGADRELERIADALAPGFQLVAPDGTVLDRERVVAGIADGRSAVPPCVYR